MHLGVPDKESSFIREQKLVRWLENAVDNGADAIFLVGDIFDFWFEYKHVVPRGYVRLLGALAKISDKKIPIHYFTGNHDMWMFGYLEQEVGVTIHREPTEFNFDGKKLFVGHGDGLGPGDNGFKFLKRVFSSSLMQWCFARLHPNFAFSVAKFWSYKSREANTDSSTFDPKNEWLYQFCLEKLQKNHYDFFVFGHRHLPINHPLPESSTYINLGDWITQFNYAIFENGKMNLHKWEK